MDETLAQFAPHYIPEQFSALDQSMITPFFTNLDKPVYVPLIFSPELIGALCSRTSRAATDLRRTFLEEYIRPFLHPERSDKDTDESWAEKQKYGDDLGALLKFAEQHPLIDLFSNPRARSFYVKWLAQYGDDSIAQMAGTHLVFGGLSQVAIKHFEDQRIGLAPIEKSTRYVNYGEKVSGRYLYYTDPTLQKWNLTETYEKAMDGLFETYRDLLPKLRAWLQAKYPEEKPAVVEKKAFDTLRGLLPSSSLSQVAFFGNGQAFEYLVSRSREHPLGEIQWAAQAAFDELYQVTPSFLRRLIEEEKHDLVVDYQRYLAQRRARMAPLTKEVFAEEELIESQTKPDVRLVMYDPSGQDLILAGMLYNSPDTHRSFATILKRVQGMADQKKERIIDENFRGRTQRWQKVARALELADNVFEITVNIGAYRDIHRHRMLTQMRQNFSCYHGFDTPGEIIEAGFEKLYADAIRRVEDVFAIIVKKDPELAQYATTLAHRIRFLQKENLRQSFWQIELRSIPEGHPDYRAIVQEKFRLIEPYYPLLLRHMRVNLGNYDFARRGQDERIQEKLKKLEE